MAGTLQSILTLILSIVEAILSFRFVLKLFAANPNTPFVAWVYENSRPLLEPFILMFPTPSVKGGYSLEFTTLFALFAYAFVGYLLMEVLDMLGEQPSRSKK